MNPEPEARSLKRAAPPRRRTIAAVAIGALAVGALAVLPNLGAQAIATTNVRGKIVNATTSANAANGVTVTAYRVAGAVGTGAPVTTTTAAGDGTFDFLATLDTANTYKFKVAGPGLVSAFYKTASATSPYTPTAGNTNSFADASAITPVASTQLSGGAGDPAPIRLAPAGATVPSVTVTSAPLDNSGNPTTGNAAPGQRSRVTVTVTGTGGTPSGFVTLDGGTAVTADGTQSMTLSGGTATFDTVTTTTPGGARTIVASYSGDSAFSPASGTNNTTTVASGSGTITGTLRDNAGTPAPIAGVTVEAYSPPTSSSTPPVLVATTTSDASGVYRLTLPDTTAGYKLRLSKAGLVTEYERNGFSYDSATAIVVASNSQNEDETLTAPGAATTVNPSVSTVSPTNPRVGQTVTFTINAPVGTEGSVNIVGDPETKAASFNGAGNATLTTVFTSTGTKTVNFTYSGSAANRATTFERSVTVDGGSVVSGTVTKAGAPLVGATVEFFAPNATSATNTVASTTTGAGGNYSQALSPGDYKVRFTESTVVTEFFNDKRTIRTGDVVTVNSTSVTASADLAVKGTEPSTTTVTTSPASPSQGEAYNVIVKVTRTATTTGPVPTGVVRVTGSNNLSTEVVLDATGTGTFTRLDTTPGTQTLSYDYLGDSVYAPSVGTGSANVGAASTVGLTATPDPVRSGAPVTLNANIRSGSPAVEVTGGSVVFKNGTTVIGTDTTVDSGSFTIDTSTLPVGANYITAEYSGFTNVGASTSRVLQVTVLPGQGTLMSVTPKRVMQPTSVGAGGVTTLTIPAADLPANAKSVQLNVTLSGVSQTTYVSACAGGNTPEVCKNQSILNSSGDDIRNYVIVPLGGPAVNQVTFYNNAGTVLISADLAGFVVDSTDTKRGVFSTYAPSRIGDETGIPMGPKSVTTITLENVPTGATAVALNVTVSGVTDNTFVSACPPEVILTDCTKQSVINSNKKDRANFIIVPLGGPQMNKVKFYNNQGRINLILDLQGYALGNATSGADGRYLAATPVRVLEPAGITAGEFKTITLPNVPAGATSVALNLTASGVRANTFYSACPPELADALCRETSVLNSRGDDTAGFVIVKLGGAAGNQVKLYNNLGSNLITADLQGWVIG